MQVIVSPPEERLYPFNYLQIYHPWGVLTEFTFGSPRKLGSVGISMPTFYSLGESSIVSGLIESDNSCFNNARCAIDTRQGYDLMQSNPLKHATNLTWGDALQDAISLEAGRGNLTNIAALKSGSRYWVLIDTIFTETYFKPITAALIVLSFQTHHVTRNLWALRRNRLVEISKSGVQLQRRDGKCLPSDIALCPACQWAPSGLPCRPCSEINRNSQAWIAKCNNSCSATSRRLLAEGGESRIKFTLTGNFATIKANWPSASETDAPYYNITITTADPISEMRRIREKLPQLSDVQVVTQPSETILIGGAEESAASPTPSPPTTPEKASNSVAIIVVIISVVVVIALASAYFLIRSNHYQEQRIPRPAPFAGAVYYYHPVHFPTVYYS